MATGDAHTTPAIPTVRNLRGYRVEGCNTVDDIKPANTHSKESTIKSCSLRSLGSLRYIAHSKESTINSQSFGSLFVKSGGGEAAEFGLLGLKGRIRQP